MEAARFWGYRLGEWEREEPHLRARCIAHYWEHGTRKAYAEEKTREAAERRKGKSPGVAEVPDWSRFRQGGGVG